MEAIVVKWKFWREGILPIIKVRGESKDTRAEGLLLRKAVMIIQQSEEYKGKLWQEKPKAEKSSAITLSFSLIFPTEAEASRFQEFLRHIGK